MKNVAQCLADISGLDLETCAQIIALFKEQSLCLIEDVRAKATTEMNDEVAALLHKLKGSSSNICATEITELAVKAEAANGDRHLELLMELVESIDQAIKDI